MVRRKKASSPFGVPFKLPKNTPLIGIGTTKPRKDTRRAFTQTQKNDILHQQDSKCASSLCHHKKLDPRTMEFDHKKPWASGGRTIAENGRALCPECHKIITHNQRLRKIDKKRPTRDSNPFFKLI
jgi:nitrate/TMAO reductase-like tetraheme cytochrome c subunit